MKTWLPIAGILAALAGLLASQRRSRMSGHRAWSQFTDSV